VTWFERYLAIYRSPVSGIDMQVLADIMNAVERYRVYPYELPAFVWRR
jgi:hypothetical protein